MQSQGSTKAVARSSQASEPSKSLSAADYFAIADRDFPGGGLGGYALPEAVRFLPARARGSRIEDIEGRSYIDFVGGAGAMILGHAHPAVTAAITEQAALGTHFFGTLNQPALHLAELMRSALPYAEKIAFTTSGSEATFYALRMCRAFTGRDKILKFDGAYHGNHDYSVVSFASKSIANYPVGRADTGGVPSVLPPTVLVAPYNDLTAVQRIVEEHRHDLAAIIVEPVQRVVPPLPDFLPGLRKIADEFDVPLVFDEVVTGFRLALRTRPACCRSRSMTARRRPKPCCARWPRLRAATCAARQSTMTGGAIFSVGWPRVSGASSSRSHVLSRSYSNPSRCACGATSRNYSGQSRRMPCSIAGIGRSRRKERSKRRSRQDYAGVYPLMRDLLAEASEIKVRKTTAETVAALNAIAATGRRRDDLGIPVRMIAKKLRLDTSATYRRLRAAEDAGVVINLEERPRRPGRYQLTSVEPATPASLLPTPEQLSSALQEQKSRG